MLSSLNTSGGAWLRAGKRIPYSARRRARSPYPMPAIPSIKSTAASQDGRLAPWPVAGTTCGIGVGVTAGTRVAVGAGRGVGVAGAAGAEVGVRVGVGVARGDGVAVGNAVGAGVAVGEGAVAAVGVAA